MKLVTALITVCVLSAAPALAQDSTSGPPQWYRDHIVFMTRDGGHWQAPNAEYSESNPYTHYGIRWTVMPGQSGMTGRLFGVREDGGEDEFWQFREFWDTGRHEARVFQWGLGGAVGEGEMIRYGDRFSTIRQTFSWPNGARTEGGHIVRTPDDATYIAEQYRVNDQTAQWEFEHALTFRRTN
ncbi:hypothetical protein [Hyphobacterium sp.]|jgi:hypothetical protein|uniref:hypothetical protein n=1 Tax=Hyphobacterium sp. TaxID=2004662 RepID=UPI003BAB162B